MPNERGRSTVRVVLVIAAILVALWAVRFAIGAVVGLVKLALVVGVLVVAAYAGYRVWSGPRRAT